MTLITPKDLDGRSTRPNSTGVSEAIIAANAAFDEAYMSGHRQWIVMFSGGKDSTALTVLAIEWLKKNPKKNIKLNIIFSNTQVEIPSIYAQTNYFLDKLGRIKSKRLKIHRVEPKLEKSFWVLMIGKGYPAPNQNFRWCTDKMKVQPSQEIIDECVEIGKTAVFTGVRFGESDVRDNRLYSSCSRGGECGQGIWIDEKKRRGASYFAPIAFWRQCDVWDYVNFDAHLLGYPTEKLETIYNGKDTRFGCWTCTVVTRDKAMERTVDNGSQSLRPMLEFRNWLVSFSFDADNRVKRSGGVKGRLTLGARKIIFDRLLDVEEKVKFRLITQEQIDAIKRYWEDTNYDDEY